MSLSPEAKRARAKYMREWRKKNPEKQREYNARKWEKKAEKLRAERQQKESNRDVLPDM